MLAALLLTLGLTVYNLSELGQAHPTALAGVWLVLLIYQEFKAIRLPGLGFFSVSQPFWLTLGLLEGGPPLATLGVGTALTLRSLFQGAPENRNRVAEALSEALPVLLSLTAIGWVGRQPLSSDPWLTRGLAGGLVYLIALLISQDRLSRMLPAAARADQKGATAILLGVAQVALAGGLALAWVAPQQAIPALLVAGLCLQLPIQAQALLNRREDLQRGNLMRQMERQQREQQVLETASRTLIQVRSLPQTAQELVSLSRQLAQAQSTAVFLWKEKQLQPVAWQSPHAARLQQGFREECLQLACQSGQACQQTPEAGSHRIFPDETQVVAFPLGNFGVLYLGRSQSSFTPSEVRYLAQAANQGTLALQIASHMESLQSALQQLKAWTATLNQLMFFSVELSERLDAGALAERLQQAATRLVPGPQVAVDLSLPEEPLAQAVAQSRAPAMIPDLSATTWKPFQPGLRSVLYIPILHPELPGTGLIRLGSPELGAFSRLQHDALCLLASLGAVAWKNLELRQQQQQAQAQVAHSSRLASVGQLAAGIAHEINTPLGSINLNVDLALRTMGKSPAEAEKRLHKSKEMIAQAREIIEKLLVFARPEPSEEGQSSRPLADLNQVVEQTLQLFGSSLDMTDLELQWNPGSGMGLLPMAVNEIQQVLLNLLLNARDAVRTGPSRSLAIVVRTRVVEGGAWLEVLDQGPGLEASLVERIFDPFFTTKPVGQGTGLGLSVARQIAEAHHGRLTVQSALGQGACFGLFLPGADQGMGR